MRFSNPHQFLDYVKIVDAKAFPKVQPDQAFLRIHADQIKEFEAELPSDAEPLDWVVSELTKEVVQALSEHERARFEGLVAVGCLEHTSVNAQILRSDDNWYSIVLNKGLMMLLNKFIKLVAAAREPEAVVYNNRGNPSEFDGIAYLTLADEVIEHYAKTGIPLGPRLKFDMKSSASAFVSSNLRAVELFVLCHEVGHFFNGDLSGLSCYSRWQMDKQIGVFKNERLHECEFAADRFAFEHILRITSVKNPSLPAVAILCSAATLTFNLLRGISNRECYSHPSPSVRLVSLTRTFFGDAAANGMERSFSDQRAVSEFQSSIGDISVMDVLRRRDAVEF